MPELIKIKTEAYIQTRLRDPNKTPNAQKIQVKAGKNSNQEKECKLMFTTVLSQCVLHANSFVCICVLLFFPYHCLLNLVVNGHHASTRGTAETGKKET